MADNPKTSAEDSKGAMRAALHVPDTAKETISSKEMIRALGAFQEEITKIMVALGTKGPNDVISIELGLNFPEHGIKRVESANPGRPKCCTIVMDCNGP